TDNAPGSPHIVQLTGSGTVAVANLSPTSLSFGSQAVGTTSAQEEVTLTNSGGAPLNINRIATAGDFSQTNKCGASLDAGSHCTISVTFAPSDTGNRTGTLSVTDDAAGSPHTVTLSGTGEAASLGLEASDGSSTSVSVHAGSSATFNLSIGGHGTSGQAT